MYNTILEELMVYSSSIISGEILACKKHIKVCKRFLNDLQKMEHEESFSYYWDEAEAQKIVAWFSYMKHSKGILAGTPIILTTFQKFIVCNIYAWKHNETKYRRFKYAYIQLARKNSKSQLEAGMASYEAAARGVAAAEIYTLGVEREQAKIVFDEKRTRPKASEVERLWVDNTKAKKILGWEPKVSLEEGLRITIDWISKHLELYKPDRYVM